MYSAKKKGLTAFLIAMLASAVVAGVALLAAPATAHAAEGDRVVESGGEYYDSIAAAITDNKQNIGISADYAEDVVIPEGKTVNLYLNGHTLTNVAENTISNYGTLNVFGDTAAATGTVTNGTNGKAAIYNAPGATATVSDGTITRTETSDYYVILNKGTFIFEDGTMLQPSKSSSGIASGYYTTPTGYSEDVYLTIKGGTFASNYITIKNDEVSNLTIIGGSFDEVEGYSSNQSVQNWTYATIKNGTFNSQVISWGYQSGETTVRGELTIENGTFNSGVGAIWYDDVTNTNYMDDAHKVAISGGTFAVAPAATYIAAGSLLSANADGTIGVADEETVMQTAVATIGDVYYSDLQAAIEKAQADETVVLIANISCDECLVISKSVNLDLNNYTITAVSGEKAYESLFSISGDGNVTIENGSLSADPAGVAGLKRIIFFNGSELTLNNVVVNAESRNMDAILIYGKMTNTDAVAAYKDGDYSQFNTLNINNSAVTGYSFAVNGNALGIYDGTIININNSRITDAGDTGTAIFHPQFGLLNIEGQDTYVCGATAVEMRAGILNIEDGTLKSTTGEIMVNPNPGSGNSIYGTVVAISQHSTNLPVVVNVAGGTFEVTGNGASIYEEDLINDTENDKIGISITGGIFNGAIESQNVTGFITGGTFNTSFNQTYLSDGAVLYPSENAFIAGSEQEAVAAGVEYIMGKVGYLSLEDAIAEGAVATVGNKAYTNLQDAVAEAQSGDTVELVADVANTANIRIDKSLTVEGNNFTITTTKVKTVFILTGTAKGSEVNLRNINIVSNYTGAFAVHISTENIVANLYNVHVDFTGANGNSQPITIVSGKDIVVNINESDIWANDSGYAIILFGKANINVTNSDLRGWAVTYFKNASSNENSSGSVVTIEDSTIDAQSSMSDHHYSFGTFVFENVSDVELNVSGCDITSIRREDSEEGQWQGVVSISGATSHIVTIFEENDVTVDETIPVFVAHSTTEDNINVTVNSGTFNNILDAADYLAEDVMAYPNAEGSYTVGSQEEAIAAGAKAAIGKVAYESLSEAVANVKDGETITVLADDLDANGIVVPSDSNFTIDFNGHTYVVTKNLAGSSGTETQAFQLLKGSTIVMKNGCIKGGADNVKMLIQNYSDLTLENMTLDAANSTNASCEALSVNNGNVVIKGNTQLLAKDTYYAFDVYYWPTGGYPDGATVTFDETFTGEVKGIILYSGDNADMDKKLAVTINGNGLFDVTISAPKTATIKAYSGNFVNLLPIEYVGKDSAVYTDNNGAYKVAASAPEGMSKVAVTVNGQGYSSIAAALEATEGEVEIKLYDDIAEDVVIPADRKVTLDLNGKTITNVTNHTITNYGTLTVKGEGFVNSSVDDRAALYNASGATATINGGTFTRDEGTWYVIANDGAMTINDAVAENSSASDQSSLIINNWSYGKNTVPATLEIENGTFTCTGGNVVKNDEGNGLVTINGGEFITSAGGFSAVQNWSNMVINGGRFVNDGASGTALHVAVYGGQTNNTEINGGEFVADNAVLLDNGYEASYGTGNIDFAVTSGTFEGAVKEKLNFGLLETDVAAISGGTFDTAVPEDFLAEGFVLNYNAEDGTFAPVEKIAFAHVERGGKIYSFAQPDQAIAFAEEGETVVLDVSFKIPGSLVINKAVNLDLNGQTIIGTVSGRATLQINGLEEGKSFDVNVFSSVEGAKIVSEKSLALWALHDANVTVTGITVEGFGTAIQVGIANSARTASLTVNDCEVIATSEDINDVPAGIFVVGNVTEANAEDYGTLQPVTLIVNDSHITGYAYGVVGNGLNHNTYIELNNTDIDGYMADGGMSIYSTGIFHPQNGTMIVNGGSIIAENAAIEIRSGNLTIKGDAVLTATSKEFGVQSAADGTTVMGVALGISQHTTNLDLNVNIESGTFNGVKSVYEEDLQDDLSENISVNITGGQFNGAVESKDVTGFITGGQFRELPAEEAFAEGLEGELYNGYYVVVNASEAGTAATIADRLAAQNDLRAYLAAFGLTLADMEAAESDEFAAAVTAAYEEIFLANTKDDIATALAAAMDAVDAYRANLAAEKAAAIEELNTYAAGTEELAAVAVPTYAVSAINGAVTVAEVSTYVDLAKAEMDDIRAERAKAEEQFAALNAQFEAVKQALGISGNAEEGYTSEVLDKLNGVIEALGITESDGAWSTTLLDEITADIQTANANITAMQTLLGKVDDGSAAQTVIGMIKATQESIAAAEADITSAISTLSADINSKYDTLIAAVNGLPTADTFEQLSGTVSELAGKVDAMNTAVSGFETTVTDRLNGIDEAIGGLTEAQNALTEAVNGYKAAVDSTLADFNAKFAELSAKVDELPTSDELKQSLTDALSLVHSKLDAIKTETDKIDGLHDSITNTVSEDIAAAFNEFEETFTGAMNGINTKLDSLDSAIAALPDDADITALKEAVQAATDAAKEAGTKVDTLGTTLGGRFDSVDSAITSIDGAIDGLTAAQNAMNEAMTAFRSELNTTLSGVNEAIAAVKADVKALADTAAADKVELLDKLTALQTKSNEIADAIASLDGDNSADLSALAADLAELQSSLDNVSAVVDEVALGNQNSSSSFAGIYVYLSIILVLAAVILIVISVKKRR